MTNFHSTLILNQLPGCIGWKDVTLKYQGANTNLLNAMQLDRQEELVGLNDQQLGLNSKQANAQFKQQDLRVLQGQSLEIIHQLESPGDGKTYLLQKNPLRDERNKIIGLIYQCIPWTQPELLQLLKSVDQRYQPSQAVSADYHVDENQNPLKLSKRELECLFLLLRGQTAQQTADILKLSRRTIESYLDNIKTKFGCFNKSELLIKAITLGYQNHLPKSLLDKDLTKIFK